MQTISKRLGISVLLVTLFGLSACNTAEGIGKDMRAAGDSIRRAAE